MKQEQNLYRAIFVDRIEKSKLTELKERDTFCLNDKKLKR